MPLPILCHRPDATANPMPYTRCHCLSYAIDQMPLPILCHRPDATAYPMPYMRCHCLSYAIYEMPLGGCLIPIASNQQCAFQSRHPRGQQNRKSQICSYWGGAIFHSLFLKVTNCHWMVIVFIHWLIALLIFFIKSARARCCICTPLQVIEYGNKLNSQMA